MRKAALFAVLTAMLVLGTSPAEARSLTVVGWLEDAVLLPSGLPVKAKMDTGAKTTSLNAHDITYYKKGGKDWVKFTVDTFERRMIFRRPVERIVKIRRAGVGFQKRPVVRIELCIAGYFKRAQVNLTDRTGMTHALLVGRRFMETGGLVIDSGRTYIRRPHC